MSSGLRLRRALERRSTRDCVFFLPYVRTCMSSFAGPSRSRLSAAEDGQAIPLLRTGGHYVLNTPPPPRPLSAHDKKLLVRVLHDVEFRFHRRKHRFPWVCCFTVIVLLLFSFVILLLYGRVHFSGALTGTGGAVEDIVGGGLSCGSCLTALAPLKALAEKGEASFADAFVGVCTDFKVSSDVRRRLKWFSDNFHCRSRSRMFAKDPSALREPFSHTRCEASRSTHGVPHASAASSSACAPTKR